MLSFKKIAFVLVVSLALGACASKTPPPPQNNVIAIPIQLVNIEASAPVVIPDQPSTKKIVKITKGDDKEQALDSMIDYTKELHDYAKNVTRMLVISDRENAVMRSKLESIKRYILISQNPTGGQPVTIQPVPNY